MHISSFLEEGKKKKKKNQNHNFKSKPTIISNNQQRDLHTEKQAKIEELKKKRVPNNDYDTEYW